MKFVDEVEITASSGKGGAGSVSFRREAMAPRGGPDGGDGGRGGHIYFRVNPQLNSLLGFRYKKKYAAANGQAGRGRNQTGADGQDLFLEVPLGTLVRDADSDEILFDLSQAGEHLFLSGGRGGKGNWFFRTAVNQAPEKAQPGEAGQSRKIRLELKLLADVGVIGFPNAGKSTLISAISAARPKIADYPFTTLTPHLGVVSIDEERTMVVADIPGLVPGASSGVGLGIQFLKHIERTRVFIHLIDIQSAEGRDPIGDFEAINLELARYDELVEHDPDYRPLTERPQVVVLNKIDTVKSERWESVVSDFKGKGFDAPLLISGAAQRGLRELIFRVDEVLRQEKEREKARQP
jgi:GTP-binding protein